MDANGRYDLPTGPTNSLVDVPGILVGHYQPGKDVYRGATAVLIPGGGLASVAVRGSNPGTIETDTLAATAIDVYIHGISLCGGSLFGLAAARGIMDWCQENQIGLKRHGITLPVIPGAVIYDLRAEDPNLKPTAEWGYRAAAAASRDPFERGNAGAGLGGTAGKGEGMVRVKGGLGSASLLLPGGIVVAALAVVNSLGSPIEAGTGKLYARDGGHDIPRLFRPYDLGLDSYPDGNTTLGVVATNCMLTKAQLAKIADLTHNGFARAIRPMHTMLDGDTIFSVSLPGEERLQPEHHWPYEVTDIIGTAAADVMVLALLDAFMQAGSISGFPSCREVMERFENTSG
jgi:L-aminopeptidase/D-esterase-like protein